MASNGCITEDRVMLSGIADQFADFLLENKDKLERMKKREEKQKMEPNRARRSAGWGGCVYMTYYSCGYVDYKYVCKEIKYWDCS